VLGDVFPRQQRLDAANQISVYDIGTASDSRLDSARHGSGNARADVTRPTIENGYLFLTIATPQFILPATARAAFTI